MSVIAWPGQAGATLTQWVGCVDRLPADSQGELLLDVTGSTIQFAAYLSTGPNSHI